MTTSNSNSVDLPDYEKWVSSNSPKKFSLFDYMHGVFNTKNIASDFAVAFLKLCAPDFYLYEGCVFLEQEFSKSKYDDLVAQGYKGKDLEYWMNLLSVDGLFESASLECAKYIADHLAILWKIKLQTDFPEMRFDVRGIVEADEDEVYVVFCQQS